MKKEKNEKGVSDKIEEFKVNPDDWKDVSYDYMVDLLVQSHINSIPYKKVLAYYGPLK
jgi:hypothetical protein